MNDIFLNIVIVNYFSPNTETNCESKNLKYPARDLHLKYYAYFLLENIVILLYQPAEKVIFLFYGKRVLLFCAFQNDI